jgi:isocitrate dehydrogenase kinase/phosphatase
LNQNKGRFKKIFFRILEIESKSPTKLSDSLNSSIASIILNGFVTYREQFKNFTKLAPELFRQRNWQEIQSIHRKRLQLYKDILLPLAKNCREILKEKKSDRTSWKEIKEIFSELISNRDDRELAETFFNSSIRKSFPGISIDEELMFVMENFNSCQLTENNHLFHSYPASLGLNKILRKILEDFDFGVPYLNWEQDISFLHQRIKKEILSQNKVDTSTTTQILKSVFYRNKAAYLIGRTYLENKWMPFVIPIMHGERGIFVDTLILDPNLMSGMFSFTRSYFMVEAEIPSEIVAFLNSVIPQKKIHELYNAIGFNKHGKTLFYRDFLHHLEQSQDLFIEAPGIKGLVMTVFTLPSFNIVIKLIKDHFEPPKDMTRQEVRAKYKLVSLHDRVGRMADTHEFEFFKIPIHRIHPDLIEELRNSANSLLLFKEKYLIIKHLYTERRMIPLNIYLEKCTTEHGLQISEEYGRAILQLAQANIFPGDMMTKNFGVTRQNRVIFYDYDEIEFLTSMNFRAKPKAETYEQIYAPVPWYPIEKNDVFPEDFKRWMIGRSDLKEHFITYHASLFDPLHWQNIQERIRKGELIHAFPYPEELRFRKEQII